MLLVKYIPYSSLPMYYCCNEHSKKSNLVIPHLDITADRLLFSHFLEEKVTTLLLHMCCIHSLAELGRRQWWVSAALCYTKKKFQHFITGMSECLDDVDSSRHGLGFLEARCEHSFCTEDFTTAKRLNYMHKNIRQSNLQLLKDSNSLLQCNIY